MSRYPIPMRVIGYVTDPTPMGTADALLPVYPLRTNLYGYRHHKNGADWKGMFNICVCEGRGIMVTEEYRRRNAGSTWMIPLQQYNPPVWLPAVGPLGNEFKVRITGLVDVRFWVAGPRSQEYIEFNTCAMVTDTPGALGSCNMWIGSNTMRIWPDPNPQKPKDFICRVDSGRECEVQGCSP